MTTTAAAVISTVCFAIIVLFSAIPNVNPTLRMFVCLVLVTSIKWFDHKWHMAKIKTLS